MVLMWRLILIIGIDLFWRLSMYCKKCNVKLNGTYKKCPLCHSNVEEDLDIDSEIALVGVEEPKIKNKKRKKKSILFEKTEDIWQDNNHISFDDGNVFPKTNNNRQIFNLFFRGLLFLTIAGLLICIMINISLGGTWSKYVFLGLLSFWTVVYATLRLKYNLAKNIVWLVFILSTVSVIWDWMFGFVGWSIDFVIPILCSIAIVGITVVARVQKFKLEDYLMYLLLDLLMGFVPFILSLFGLVKIKVPTIVCVSVMIATIVALIVFRGKALKNEIIRRMHL